MTDRELMQQALEKLEFFAHMKSVSEDTMRLITTLRERLAQPEQEPVALETVYETIIQWDEGGGKRSRRELARRIVALYTTPPRLEWAGLDRKEMLSIIDQQGAHKATGLPMFYRDQCLDMLRAIEAKLREKNA